MPKAVFWVPCFKIQIFSVGQFWDYYHTFTSLIEFHLGPTVKVPALGLQSNAYINILPVVYNEMDILEYFYLEAREAEM